MSDAFENDVFISYSSADRAWAEKLSESLTAKGLTTYLDDERLQAGEGWLPQLLGALKSSRHLVVLWSNNAAGSQWVAKELSRFDALVDPDGRSLTGERRLLIVVLEGESAAYTHVQQIHDIKQAGLYPGDPAVSSPVWQRVVERVVSAVGAEEGFVSIPLLLVTTTSARLDAFDADPEDAPALATLLQELGIDSDALNDRYGETRGDWRPFGSERTIRAILEGLKDKLNAEIAKATGGNGTRFRWEYVDAEFWSADWASAEAVTKRLASGPVQVVVDPLSFYDPLVRTRYGNYVRDILDNGDAFVLVLTPFAPPTASLALRGAIQSLAKRIFQHFYEPPAFSGAAYARCGFNVGDEIEFLGWLTTALGPSLRASQATGAVYLAPGPRT